VIFLKNKGSESGREIVNEGTYSFGFCKDGIQYLLAEIFF